MAQLARGPRRRVRWGTVGLYAAAALVAAWLLWAGRSIWFPLSLAFVIAMVLDPTVDRLENRGVPRALGTGIVFLAFLGGLIAALVLLTPLLSEQAGRMAADISRLFPDPNRPDLVPVAKNILAKLDANPALRDPLLNAARAATTRLSESFSRGSTFILAWIPNLTWVVVVPVIAFYALIDFHKIYAKAVLLVPANHRPLTQTLIAEITAVFGNYLRGMGKICLLLGLSIAALLWAFGNPYWPLLGLLGGLLYAIPVVGSLFNLALVLLIGLVIGPPGKALLAAGAVFLLTSGLFDQVVTPRIIGKQVGLHPIFTILALLLGFQIAGIGGMLVAVPLAACAQTVIVHLIPKLGIDLELRSLEELKQTEEETREAHVQAEEAEEEHADEHIHLHTVIENVEAQSAENG